MSTKDTVRAVVARLDAHASFERTASRRSLTPPSSLRRLLDELGRPDEEYRIVHVAGTHGKGLTAAMIAAALERGGDRTGLYTSPVVHGIREGIVIGGAPVPTDAFVRAAEIVLAAAEGFAPSRFDLVTAIAFMAFAEAGVERAVIETGLGGRFDATNVTAKELAVITPVDYDHTELLGPTLAEIARHKAGILRPGVPWVTAAQAPEVLAVLEDEADGTAPGVPVAVGAREVHWPDGGTSAFAVADDVAFVVYRKCLETALAALWQLVPQSPRRAEWIDAALDVRLPGRLERRRDVVWHGKRWREAVFDGCHSPAAVRACAEQLEAWGVEGYVLVLGMSGDKLTEHLREPLMRQCAGAQEVIFTGFRAPRAAAPERIAELLPGVHARTVADPEEAGRLASAWGASSLVVAGSLYLVGEALADSTQAW